MRKYGIWLVLLLCICSLPSAALELEIENNSFEKVGKGNFPQGWFLLNKEGKGQISLAETVAYDGKKSLLLSGENPKDRAGVYTSIALPQGRDWEGVALQAKIWYCTKEHRGTTMFKVEGINKEKNKVLESYLVTLPEGTAAWQEAVLNFKLRDSKTTFLWIHLYLRDGCGKVWFDQLSLKTVESEISTQSIGASVMLDFEDGQAGSLPTGWVKVAQSEGATFGLGASQQRGGTKSLHLSGQSGESKGILGLNPLPNFQPEGGKRYKVSAWCKSQNLSGTPWLKLEFYDSSVKQFFGNFVLTPKAGTHDWYLLEAITPKLAEGTAIAWLNIGLYPGAGDLWVDDFQITEVTTEEELYTLNWALGFEKEAANQFPNGWAKIVLSDGATAKIDNQIVHSGQQSLYLEGKQGADRALIGLNPIPGFRAAEGKRYRVSAWLKSEDLQAASSWIKLEFYSSQMKFRTVFNLIPKQGTHDWYRLEGTTPFIPEDTSICWLNIGLYPGTGKLWVDDIELVAEAMNFNSMLQPPPNEHELHPCLRLSHEELVELRACRQREPFKSMADSILRAADGAMGAPLEPEPAPYPGPWDIDNAQRIQDAGVRVANNIHRFAFAYLISGEGKYANEAKRWIGNALSWDVNGTTSTAYHDGASRPLLENLTLAYDWMFETFSQEEIFQLRKVIYLRAQELFNLQVYPLTMNPYDSHHVTSADFILKSALVLRDIPEAKEWLDFVIKFYRDVYPPWGGKDGGWSEGVNYYKWSIDNGLQPAEILRAHGLINLFEKDWFKNTGYFKIYCDPVGAQQHPWGDDTHGNSIDSYDFTLMWKLAMENRNPYFMWYANKSGADFYDTTEKYFMTFRAQKMEPMLSKPPLDLPRSKCFWDIGWVAMHSNLVNFGDDIHLMFKSSPYGTWSHSHSDQNAFTVSAFGEPLAISSGYYDYYGSPQHVNFARTTRSKNTILVNNQGQLVRDMSAIGSINSFYTGLGYDYALGKAEGAYPKGLLDRYDRQILFNVPDYFIILDDLASPSPSKFSWLLHSYNPMQLDEKNNSLYLERNDAKLKVEFLAPRALRFEHTDLFLTESSEEKVFAANEIRPTFWFKDDPNHYHFAATSKDKSENQYFLTVLQPFKAGDENELLKFAGGVTEKTAWVQGEGKNYQDFTLFALAEEPLLAQGFKSEGKILSLRRDQAGKLVKFIAIDTQKILRDEKLYASSSAPMNISVEYLPLGRQVQLELVSPGTVKLQKENEVKVLVDGKEAFGNSQGLIEIALEAGSHIISLQRGEEQVKAADLSPLKGKVCIGNETATIELSQSQNEISGDLYASGQFQGMTGSYTLEVDYNELYQGKEPTLCNFSVWVNEQKVDEFTASTGQGIKLNRRIKSLKLGTGDFISFYIYGNGMGKSCFQLGNVKISNLAGISKLPQVADEKVNLEQGVLIMAADITSEQGGRAKFDAKPASYKQSSIMDFGGRGHTINWKFSTPETKDYMLLIRGATSMDNIVCGLEIDGNDIAEIPAVELSSTGGWGTNNPDQWRYFLFGRDEKPILIHLTEGEHILTISSLVGKYINLNYFLFLPGE